MDKNTLPNSHRVLLLVDVINPLDFVGAQDLAAPAVEAARSINALKTRLRKAGVPAIYANDNYGLWQSNFHELVHQCLAAKGPASELAEMLCPKRGDLTILKPRHSAFLGTPLDLMLTAMQARTVIVVGFATDMCIQLTAMDGFLRNYEMAVPSDCTAAESDDDKKQSLHYMARVLKCDTSPSSFIA